MANPQEYGLYIPSTYLWDVEQVSKIDVNSPEFKELLIRLYQNINSICIAVNLKDSAYYNTQEFVNGQSWFPNPAYNSANTVNTTVATFRQNYRQVVNFGALPNAAEKSVAHYIPFDPAYSFTRLYAVATDPVGLTSIPIPYVDVAGTGAANIQLDIDSTNVNITTTANSSNYTICYVVIEYLKT